MSKTSLAKINLKDKINDGEIDLSLCELQEVPVKEIAAVRKIHSLDLSTNLLVKLPHNFSTLTHLTKLDLSKNKLRTLPENFGNLTKLRYLDLYKNEIEFLPLSFYKLKSLRWLDLKDNPLAQSIKDIAGPCVDAQDCQRCAHEIVKFFTEFDDRLNAERKKREEHRQQSKVAREQAEQKVKKQEKKKKKKEKQLRNLELYEPIDLLSYEEVNDGYGYDGEVNSYKSYKDVERKKKSFFANIVKTGFKMVLVIAFVFVVSTAKHDVAVRFSNNVANMYNGAVQNLPFNAQYYFVAFGENVFKCHKATAEILSNFIDNVGKAIANRHVSFDYLVYYKNQLYEKIDYFYTKYVS